MDAELLRSLTATVASEHRPQDALDAIVKGIATLPGVARAGLWLIGRGDLCEECPLRAQCPDQTQCLHLTGSAGVSRNDGGDWSNLESRLQRIPLNHGTLGTAGATGNAVLINDLIPDGEWITPDLASREGIRSLSAYPLIFHGRTLGVLAILRREPLSEENSAELQTLANLAAVAIGNAETFENHSKIEKSLQEHIQQLRQIIDVVPAHLALLEPDLSDSLVNRPAREYFGFHKSLMPQKMTPWEFLQRVTHPEDIEPLQTGIRQSLSTGKILSIEIRMRSSEGQYRWFLYQLHPLRDETGRVFRWCAIRTDIDDQKRAQERAQRENLALRDEIDKLAMSEEIVGSSAALQAVLTRVSKVAGTDSTVLIMGETGTGKELIARAIHRGSRRADRALVSVNCAAIPKDLIASELFGHEKGAFTGALQRRLGRFELAEGGSIFLDEIGELPAETQIALLRVLQEREFQRVGGNQSMHADVRVIAATHRDLPAAVEAGSFRSDLFYRINVFPIHIPPLRERKEDIQLLVEYFVHRYSSKVGKRFRHIQKKSLDLLESYPWPGNIRELQNVIERSVIVCENDVFSVDESWLSGHPKEREPLSDALVNREKEMIEAALAESRGRVSGPHGAAVKLGMPASTLDSKLRALKIDKHRFHTSSHT